MSGDPLFLIGTQRSGTTWVANVVNRSESVLLFYEPFQKGLGLFDAFPEEPVYLASGSASLIEALSSQYQRMISQAERYYFRDKWKRYAVGKTVSVAHNLYNRGFGYKGNTFRQLRVLNQWHGDKVREHLVSKSEVLRPFIKETRLHLKIPVLFQAFTEARIGLLLRHPYPVIKSILSWFERGRLFELRKKLDYMFDIYRTQNLLNERERELVERAITGGIKEKLVAHWFISNDGAAEYCESNPSTTRIFVYEALCKDSVTEFGRMLDFYGMPYDASMKDYVVSSSTKDTGSSGVVDTVNDSQQKYREWLEGASKDDLYQQISKYSPGSRAYGYIISEYEGLGA